MKISLPNFSNKIVEQLYFYDHKIDQKILRDIISLGSLVIPDLELVLEDVIKNEKIYAHSESKINFQVISHAMHLLGELRAENSLDKILEVYAQPKDFLEWWFNDSLIEEIWEVPYRCTNVKQLHKLEKFMKNKNYYMYSRTAVGVALVQIALHKNNDVAIQIIEMYGRILEDISSDLKPIKFERSFFVPMPDGFTENTYLSFLFSDVLDIVAVIGMEGVSSKMYNLIESLFENKLFDENIVGGIETLSELKEIKRFKTKKEVKGIFTIYDSLGGDYSYSESSGERQKDESFIDDSFLTDFISTCSNKKIGRNDPCYCGSNKKYKKCCYLIDSR